MIGIGHQVHDMNHQVFQFGFFLVGFGDESAYERADKHKEQNIYKQ